MGYSMQCIQSPHTLPVPLYVRSTHYFLGIVALNNYIFQEKRRYPMQKQPSYKKARAGTNVEIYLQTFKAFGVSFQVSSL